MNTTTIKTKRGARVRVHHAGKGAPLIFLHGAVGLLPENRFLDRLAERCEVFAPELPGYGESTGEELLDDMLDFALHGWDVVGALGVEKPTLVGHSMGGMIAAEMACIAPNDVHHLALIAPAGLWLAEHPIADLFAMLPFEFARLLFHDPVAGAALLTGGLDFSNLEAVGAFYINNARQMGVAGKLLFPIPNRGLAKRLYRLTTPATLIWGENDKLIPLAYAERWKQLVPQAQLRVVAGAGHMVPYEKAEALVSWLAEISGA
ncbi:MAG TPA: alpha/beta fold hydrolase [Candidatus Acidoferrales bacterium]|nr:alpha/beta fold hydrolase [Candidatus Acidoferrales bacterium]